MKEPRWITLADVLAFHDEAIVRSGGSSGIRDRGLVESALERPRHKFHYEGSDIFSLAAVLAEGLIKNHGFVDGNKRIGFLASVVFLEDNGYRFEAAEAEAAQMFLMIADSTATVDELVAFFKNSCRPL